MRYGLRTLLIVFALAPPLVAYVGSYYALSRRGYAYADSVGSPGFWYVPPETQRDVEQNAAYRHLYCPLMRFEHLIGSQRWPAHDPCMGPELPP